ESLTKIMNGDPEKEGVDNCMRCGKTIGGGM
ncbi:unnamed protein product, partial [marine sediment metagenome]